MDFSVHVNYKILHSDDRVLNTFCTWQWWEAASFRPKGYDKWSDLDWNGAHGQTKTGREEAAEFLGRQQGFAGGKPGHEWVHQFWDSPAIDGFWGVDYAAVIFVKIESGCVQCPPCCAKILVDYRKDPIGISAVAQCGVDACSWPKIVLNRHRILGLWTSEQVDAVATFVMAAGILIPPLGTGQRTCSV